MTEPNDTTTALDATPFAPRPDVREMADRIATMLPSAKAVGPAGALALAQVALALDLNPFTGELWAWKNRDDTITLMVGIKGLRRAARAQAHRMGGHYQPHHHLPSDEDLQGVTLGPGDFARACTITLWTPSTIRVYQATGMVPDFHGLGICRAGERTKMEKVLAARKRAEADALKQAFDLPVAFSIEGSGPPQQFLPNWEETGAKTDARAAPAADHPAPPEQRYLQIQDTEPPNLRQDWDDLFNDAEGNPFQEPD